MKTKKLLIVVSMLAVMFSLAGCDNAVPKPFEYDDTQIVLDTMGYFSTYANVGDDYTSYYLSDGTAFEQSAVKGIEQAIETDKVGAFEDFSTYAMNENSFDISLVDAKIENAADSVSVTVINKAENRDVEVTIKYVENADYYIQLDKSVQQALDYYASLGYSQADILAETGAATLSEALGVEEYLQQYGIFQYTPEEMVVSAVYSKSELMKQAGMNTILGMGTVFVVLIFISFIISLFKFLPALLAKKPKLPETKSEVKPETVPVAKPVVKEAPIAGENLMNDAELVAVITAAIYAASGSGSNGAVSKDRLVVRSIRRAKK